MHIDVVDARISICEIPRYCQMTDMPATFLAYGVDVVNFPANTTRRSTSLEPVFQTHKPIIVKGTPEQRDKDMMPPFRDSDAQGESVLRKILADHDDEL